MAGKVGKRRKASTNEKAPGLAAEGLDADTRKTEQVQSTPEAPENQEEIGETAGEKLNRDTWQTAHDEALKSATDRDFSWDELADLTADGERYRAFNGVFYPDSVDPELIRKLTEQGFQLAISPLHDSDYYPGTGMKKEPHFHILLYFTGKMSLGKVRDILDPLGVKMLQPTRNITGMLRYFAHMDIDPEHNASDRGKVRYSPDDIRGYNGFDVDGYLRNTISDKATVYRELRKLSKAWGVTEYCVFVDLIDEHAPEYVWYMAQPHVATEMRQYLASANQSAVLAAKRACNEDYITVLENKLDQMMVIIQGLIAEKIVTPADVVDEFMNSEEK